MIERRGSRPDFIAGNPVLVGFKKNKNKKTLIQIFICSDR